MGNYENLHLEGDADAIKEIETKVEDGVLKIRSKKQMNTRSWNNTGKVNIYIQAKSINNLVISGSGNIAVNIEVENYIAVISSSGEVNAKGNAKNARITVAG